MQTSGITPLTHNHLKPISESPEIVYSCSVSRWPRPVFWEREWNTSVSRLSQVTSWDVRESCRKSPARFAFDAMQGGCNAPSRHISPTHAFIWCREIACFCVNLKRKTLRRSRASRWSSVSEKWTYASFFSTSLLHFFFSHYILSKLASDCIPLFSFYLWSPIQLVHQEQRGKSKMSQESECVIFKLPANSEHLILRGRSATPSMGALVLPVNATSNSPRHKVNKEACVRFWNDV